MEVELRPGSQHSQEGFIPYMNLVIDRARTLTCKKFLVRLDSAHDALETRLALRDREKVSFIIKWNPRREDTSALCAQAFAEGKVTERRPGKEVALLTIRKRQEMRAGLWFSPRWCALPGGSPTSAGSFCLPRMSRLREGGPTDLPEQKIINLYENPGLSEQFHSESRSDLDLEPLPSGKFATNALIMALGSLAHNTISCGTSAS